MRPVITLVLGIVAGAPAPGEPGEETPAETTEPSEPAPDLQVPLSPDPSEAARDAELVGPGCPFTTGMMARRVLAEGREWIYTGPLSPVESPLRSRVAAPWVVGPHARVRVVANEVIETLADEDPTSQRLVLEGRLLEVEEVPYFVVLRGHPVAATASSP